jgi:putative phosphoesterase
MKALILSDIHANIYALEAIWRVERDSEAIFCAGDLVDYGPFPREVLDWVRAHAVTCVQGNHDRSVPRAYREGVPFESIPENERTWGQLNASLLDEHAIQFLENLPRARTFELDGLLFGMTHMYRDYNEVVSRIAYQQFTAELFVHAAPGKIQRMIMGHTHRQSIRYLADDVFWMNPGSVSYRRHDDPDQAAYYATITDGKISLRRVEYDISPVWIAAQKARLKESEMAEGRYYFGPR